MQACRSGLIRRRLHAIYNERAHLMAAMLLNTLPEHLCRTAIEFELLGMVVDLLNVANMGEHFANDDVHSDDEVEFDEELDAGGE